MRWLESERRIREEGGSAWVSEKDGVTAEVHDSPEHGCYFRLARRAAFYNSLTRVSYFETADEAMREAERLIDAGYPEANDQPSPRPYPALPKASTG